MKVWIVGVPIMAFMYEQRRRNGEEIDIRLISAHIYLHFSFIAVRAIGTLYDTLTGKNKVIIAFPDRLRNPSDQVVLFHDWIIVFVTSISFFTLCIILVMFKRDYSLRSYYDSQSLECVWTALPAFLLMAIGIPSLRLLYLVEESGDTCCTIKALGNQWYWQYDLPTGYPFSSYLVKGDYRLLDTDNRLNIPEQLLVTLLISSADVLHSWTLPSLAIKADAVPGRVNKLALCPKRPGLFFGQCREICGRNHSFMPIALETFFNSNYILKMLYHKLRWSRFNYSYSLS